MRGGGGEIGGQMVIEGDLTLGNEHTIQCTDDVLWNCAPEIYIILLTSVTPITSIQREKRRGKIKIKLILFVHFAFLLMLLNKLKIMYVPYIYVI